LLALWFFVTVTAMISISFNFDCLTFNQHANFGLKLAIRQLFNQTSFSFSPAFYESSK
jgi:hypothetical protein